MKRLLITGAGKAALACIEQLTKLKHQFSISVLRGPAGPDTSANPDAGASPEDSGASPEWDERRLARLGVEVHGNVCVEAIDRYARVVRGCDGSRTTFDTLILAAGPANAALARAAGLEVHAGVLSNDYLQTSDAHVYALGDGAEHRGCVYTDAENIGEQARVLAAHIAGYYPSPFRGAANLRVAAGALELRNLAAGVAGVKACDALPTASVDSAQRSGDQTPELKDRPVLAGAA